MGRGVVVRAAGSRTPSEHFADHFPLTSHPLRGFTAGLIDGKPVTLADPVDVIPGRENRRFAQFGVVDTTVGEERAFAIALLALTAAELPTVPGGPDVRGIPVLLADFRHGSAWEAYNCHIVDFQVWPKGLLYGGTWPKIDMYLADR